MNASLDERLRGVLPPDGVGAFGDAGVPLALPSGDDEWRAVLDIARADGLRVLPIGNGSKLALAASAPAADLVVSSRRHTGVLSYEPGDGTVRARAGTSLTELADTVRAGGHRLTPEVPRPDEASLGGVLGAGQSGSDRLRFGAVRNHVLGMRVMLSDGTVASTGGQLVKNVTGYELHRLYTGSRGSLCAILDASLRLFPWPDERAVVRAPVRDRSTALDLARRALALPVRPTTVCVHDHVPGVWTLVVVVDGHRSVIDDALARTLALVGDAEVARGDESEAALAIERDREHWRGLWPTLTLEGRPSRIGDALDAVGTTALACELTTHVLTHPGIASAAVHVVDADPAALRRFCERLRDVVDGVRIRSGQLPADARAVIDDARPAPVGLALMERLRGELDPDRRFAGAIR